MQHSPAAIFHQPTSIAARAVGRLALLSFSRTRPCFNHSLTTHNHCQHDPWNPSTPSLPLTPHSHPDPSHHQTNPTRPTTFEPTILFIESIPSSHRPPNLPTQPPSIATSPHPTPIDPWEWVPTTPNNLKTLKAPSTHEERERDWGERERLREGERSREVRDWERRKSEGGERDRREGKEKEQNGLLIILISTVKLIQQWRDVFGF